jgi:hypothetical protein
VSRSNSKKTGTHSGDAKKSRSLGGEQKFMGWMLAESFPPETASIPSPAWGRSNSKP